MLKQHIITVYGETTHWMSKKLQTLNRQAASAKCKWIFLSRCAKHEILPKSFKTRSVIKSEKALRETRQHNLNMLRITRDKEKTQYHK